MAQALKFIQDSYPGQTGLVYCMTKKKTEQVAAYLRGRGVSAEHYHAGMSTQDRTTMQEKWLEGECHVIVATVRLTIRRISHRRLTVYTRQLLVWG